MPAIAFQNFSFRYHNLKDPTLKNVTLEIRPGEKVLIAGPSGSGKSTLAHCINGLIPFTYPGEWQGTLQIGSIRPYEKSIFEISRLVGTILQDQDGQFVGLNVGEDVAFGYENLALLQWEMKAGVDKALAEVGMEKFIQETPYNLSGGQKQKVSIAGILAADAEILLFDEPLANLDPVSGKRALETINRIHRDTHKTIIVIEHRIEDVLEHDFDRIVVMSEGEIVADGHPDVILAARTLSGFGLREPLYIEVLKCVVKTDFSREDRLSRIENALKFKNAVIDEFHSGGAPENDLARPAILELNGLGYRYFDDAPEVIRNVSFDIREGEMLAILGNNGAGKSTLLRLISGIARQQKGTIRYMGQPIDHWTARKRSEIIGYVMQNPNHMITKPMIFDEVAFGLRNRKVIEDIVTPRVEETLKICGIYKYRKWPVESLSYGQKKRVTIASILALRPKIIILDEPTAGQDHRNYQEFMGFLEDVKETGISIVMITHDMHLTLEYADRAVVLCDGEIIADDWAYKVLADNRILSKANLKETSVSRLARLCEVEDVGGFCAFYAERLKEGGRRE